METYKVTLTVNRPQLVAERRTIVLADGLTVEQAVSRLNDKLLALGAQSGHKALFWSNGFKLDVTSTEERRCIFATLKPTERISWVDIDYETRFNNRFR